MVHHYHPDDEEQGEEEENPLFVWLEDGRNTPKDLELVLNDGQRDTR